MPRRRDTRSGAVRMDLLLGLGAAALVAAVVAALGYTTNQQVASIFDRSQKDSREIAVDNGTRFANLLATNTATTVRPSVIDNNFSSLREVLASMTSKDDALLYIAVFDPNGETLGESGKKPTADSRALTASAPIVSRGDVLGRVELSYSLAGVESRIAAARADTEIQQSAANRNLVVGGAITLALGVLMAIGFGMWLTRPVTRLAQAAERLGEGRFDARVGVGGPREIRQLASTFNSMAGQLEESVAASIERAALEREVELAHQLQTEMMPPSERVDLGEIEIVSWYAPAGTCAGDWWTLDAPEGDQRVTVMIGDVMGHGIPAALYTAAAHSSYRTGGALGADRGPDAVLRTIDSGLRGLAQRHTMSCCAVVVDRETGQLALSAGGHPEPLCIRADGSAVEVLEGTGSLLGDDTAEPEFEQTQHQLSPGDIVVLYTDGLTEAVNAKDRMFGRRRLGKAVAERSGDELQAALESLQSAFEDYVGEVEVDDDVTVVMLRYRGGGR